MKTYILLFVMGILTHAVALAKMPSSTLSDVDRVAFNAPEFTGQSPDNLVRYCNAQVLTARERVRFYFVWIAVNIRYDSIEWLSSQKSTFKQDPSVVFAQRKALCRGYANLFTELCRKSGIPAQTIVGYTKSAEGFADPRELHAWNGVKVDGAWFLFDLTWAAGYFSQSQRIDDHFDTYFRQYPTDFRQRHLPFDPVWQLTSEVMTRSEFFAAPTEGGSKTTFTRLFNPQFYEKIEADIKTDDTEQQLRSYERAVAFMPDENRLYNALTYYQSEKAAQYFRKASDLLLPFKSMDEKTIQNWTLTDIRTKLKTVEKALALYTEALNIFNKMSDIQDVLTAKLKKDNIDSIHFNLRATQKLIVLLNDIEKDLIMKKSSASRSF